MTSKDQFEAWATEQLPTLYLTKTEQGTYESTATGSFFAAWSARDGEIEALRRQIPSAEISWCACGDGYPVNSYGAGFMDANNGVCANCDAANGGVEPDLDTPDELKALLKLASDTALDLRKASSWICREVEAGTTSATHWAIRLREQADKIDAAMSKEASDE